jgi:putative spermidine/putrescine transport system permease protein
VAGNLACHPAGHVCRRHFSFLISWDEVVLSIFMASPSLQTLPVLIWSTLRQDLTPVIAAASTLLVAFTVVLMLLASF